MLIRNILKLVLLIDCILNIQLLLTNNIKHVNIGMCLYLCSGGGGWVKNADLFDKFSNVINFVICP